MFGHYSTLAQHYVPGYPFNPFFYGYMEIPCGQSSCDSNPEATQFYNPNGYAGFSGSQIQCPAFDCKWGSDNGKSIIPREGTLNTPTNNPQDYPNPGIGLAPGAPRREYGRYNVLSQCKCR